MSNGDFVIKTLDRCLDANYSVNSDQELGHFADNSRKMLCLEVDAEEGVGVSFGGCCSRTPIDQHQDYK